MPTPLGHALGGLAAGWLVAGTPAPPRRAPSPPWIATWRGAFVFALLGMLPDIDLLFGAHSMYTHSIGAALVVLLATVALTPTHRWAAGFASAAAYGSHILLDWMGNDTTPPIGIMALWPFSSAYYESDVHWFMAITRRYHLPNFWPHNLLAIALEIGTLAPLVVIIYWLRRRAPREPSR